ncbi:membrane-associated phospholipid phosphatase [Arthrobacter sp. V4I6]|uniref:phosphatase PAP2 family protein n=1 Tax=unclassified Arthrobacter TaxID=235627 RepID=UPI002781AE53|nr:MULTISPECIES: phosphatase PAP2 family protein [unclassified Arthrobacter]MDQ0819661.1 membrane-associated phospholipid phosphatase [Arthrobacter sp. V1I7]MDQ0853841.1 membrane-associated phospholipid phosphatase [Arthrobacter sp. V4I6]
MAGKQTGDSPGRWRVFHNKFVVEERFMSEAARKKLYRIAVVLMIVGAAVFSVILAGVLVRGGVSEVDEPVRSWLLTLRSEPLTAVMIILAIVFGPVALPIIILVVTVAWGLLAKHAWRPLLLAGAMLTGVILAQVIGRTVGRQRPPVDLMLFGEDTTFAFPSGHVLGACDFLLVTTYLIFSRRRNPRSAVVGFAVAGIGIFLAAVSRLYLGYHWTSDALASLAISFVVLGAVIALDTWRTARIPGERITGILSKADTSQD